jgi:MFS family permease
VSATRHGVWTAFWVVAAIYVLGFFQRVAPAAIVGELQASFEVGAAALGVLAATYFYCYALMQVPTGVLVDTFGPRRVVAGGGVVAAIGTFVFAYAPTLGVAVTGRALVGLGVSVFFVALLKVAADGFSDRRFATATGLGVFVGNIGAVFGAAPLAFAVTLTSWRNVFACVGVLLVACVLATWRFVGDGSAARQASLVGSGAAPRAPWWVSLGGVLRDRRLWPPLLVMFAAGSTYLSFTGLWGVPYLVQVHGMTRGEATGHTSLTLFGFAAGSMFVGALSDRIGRRKPLLVGGLVVSAVCWLVLMLVPRLAAPWSHALFVLMGVSATAFTLCWAVAKESTPPHLAGMGTSLVNTGQFAGVGVLQPLIGWLLDRGWQGAVEGGMRLYSAADFRLGIAVLLAFSCVGVAASLAVRETWCRNVHVPR